MTNVGRPSKVKIFGYSDEIIELRNQGLSYEKIANTLNQRYPDNITISKDVVFRHLVGLTKKTRKDKPITIQEHIANTFQEFYYKLKTSSIDSKERSAIISYMKSKEKMLKSKVYEFYSGHDKPSTEYEKVREFVLDFSCELCTQCRQRVVKEVLKIEANDGEYISEKERLRAEIG